MHQTEGIGFQIKLIHDGINRLFRQEMGMEVPTRSQMNILHYLMDHEGEKVLVKDIVAHLHIDQSTASGIIKRMEKNGYIICFQDTEDRRQKCITINPKNNSFPAKSPQQSSKRLENALLQGLSHEEVNELRRLLDIIYKNLQDNEEKKR